jgi:hypothetical protein
LKVGSQSPGELCPFPGNIDESKKRHKVIAQAFIAAPFLEQILKRNYWKKEQGRCQEGD